MHGSASEVMDMGREALQNLRRNLEQDRELFSQVYAIQRQYRIWHEDEDLTKAPVLLV